MATIEDKILVRHLIQKDGRFGEDPLCYAIFSYQTLEKATVFLIAYTVEEVLDMFRSPWVLHPTMLWHSRSGVTPEGIDFLEET